MSRPACLIIGFKRYENIVNLITNLSIQGCKNIFLALDGQTTPEGTRKAKNFEFVLRALALDLDIDLTIWAREANYGAAVSVITAIDWFFQSNEVGVILEDDLVIGENFLDFMTLGLEKFKNDHKVFMISGSQYWTLDVIHQFYSLNYPVIWGWGTWSHKWKTLRESLRIEKIFFSKDIALSEQNFWRIGRRRCLNGSLDAWDIPIAAFFRSKSFLSILPPVNQVKNIGFDSFASNTYVEAWPLGIETKPLNVAKLDSKINVDALLNQTEIFSREIYKIGTRNLLPSPIVKILDIFRYPKRRKLAPLLDRLATIYIPRRET